jgi:hypothetical protein
MAETNKTRIGFVSGGASSMPHYNSFLPLVPAEIELEFRGLQLYGKSLYEIADKKEIIVQRVQDFIAERGWKGVIVTAAPTEVLNPGLFDALEQTLSVPFTTALHACVAALRAYHAPRVLLLTPFDARLNELIVQHLATRFSISLKRISRRQARWMRFIFKARCSIRSKSLRKSRASSRQPSLPAIRLCSGTFCPCLA